MQPSIDPRYFRIIQKHIPDLQAEDVRAFFFMKKIPLFQVFLSPQLLHKRFLKANAKLLLTNLEPF